MNPETWAAVDRYLEDLFVGADAALDGALERSAAAKLPAIQVAPVQGKLLLLLARLRGARRILELGTLGGYSTIWLARALPPDGWLVTLELEAAHAAVAQTNLEAVGVDARVELMIGPASESLARLIAAGTVPFDLVFIDADKRGTPGYLEQVLQLVRPGSLIIVDNVVRNGAVTDAASADPSVQGTRAGLELLAQHPRLVTTALQTVGVKGYDGLALALVTA